MFNEFFYAVYLVFRQKPCKKTVDSKFACNNLGCFLVVAGQHNHAEPHVHLFLDEQLQNAPALSFHPNDCRGTVVIARADFERYLKAVGNPYEYLSLY